MATTLDKTGIRPKVIKILEAEPDLPYSIIASEFGVSRERIRQIAQQNGYPPRRGILKPKICPVCGKTFYTRNQYCSPNCAHESNRNRILINCHQCGKTIERPLGTLRSKSGRYFCNKECHIEWIGKKPFNSSLNEYLFSNINMGYLTLADKKSRKKQIKEQREEQILKAALEVFTRKSHDAATIKEIAAVAGVSVGTIYNYYANKHELFIAVMKKLLISNSLLDVIDNMPKADIIVSFRQILQSWSVVEETEPGPRIYYLISEIVRDPSLRALWVEQVLQPFCKKAEATYNLMIASDQLRNVSTPIVIRAMLGLVMGFGILNYLEGDQSPIISLKKKDQIFPILADLVFNGLASDAAE